MDRTLPLTLGAAALLLFHAADRAGTSEEELSVHRNLGKAFYENPTTLGPAVEEFRKALELAPHSPRERLNYGLALLRNHQTQEGIAELEKVQKQDPKLPHTWFNLAIAYKKLGQYGKAVEQFRGMLRLVPDDPVSHFNLGLIYKLREDTSGALREFEAALELDPDLVAPRFQIFNTLRENDRSEEAERALQLFRTAKARKTDGDESEDMEWNVYAEVYDPIDPSGGDPGPPGPLKFEDRALEGRAEAKTSGMTTLQSVGGERLDLLVWSAEGVRLYRGGTDFIESSGLEALKGVIAVAPGDYDNDGLPDLCVVTASEALLYHNEKGTFRKAGVAATGIFRKAVWLDYDHDYDLDLFLLGTDSRLLRNQGTAGFADRTADFPFVKGSAIDATMFHFVSDAKGIDLVVSYGDREGVLYRDRLLGRYEATPVAAVPANARLVTPVDIDNDGAMDLAFQTPGGARLARNSGARLTVSSARLGESGGMALADLENRGVADLVAGGAALRNLGRGKLEDKASYRLPEAVASAAGDFNLDGRTDLAAVRPDGSIHLLLNETAANNRWIGVRLAGVKNLKLPYGTEVEVRAGMLYRKQMYENSALVFGMGGHRQAETVRITWANGLVQNETRQDADRFRDIKEAPRLSGSCPMIFTWNGRRFEFLTDVLGVAPLGASAGDGEFFATDHDEYVQIPGEALVPKDGRYEIRITEELSEVTYLDQVKLLAVDHPREVEIYTNDKWKAPPYPEFRLFGVERRIYPKRAADGAGRDVLERVVRRDRRYVDAFRRNPGGVAETHALELDFGREAAPGNDAVLVLNGWVDWADGSVFLSQAQEGRGGLVPPYLQVKDTSGRWRTVIEDMGMPSGKTKTIAVDLTGKFLLDSREVRIVTNMCVYWDEVFLGEGNGKPGTDRSVRALNCGLGQSESVPVFLPNVGAELHFRGFSRAVIDPDRKQPEYFDYSDVHPVSQWNSTPGMYTRYGPVGELLRDVDDRFVIMGSGDEVSLSFDAAGAPALPHGWKRDFLLLVDGWAKDRDANTMYSQTVEPLPFHGMAAYPYPATQSYPRDAFHEEYRRLYNRRPALRLLPTLAGAATAGITRASAFR